MEDCPDCIGTGISPVGRVEDSCSKCHGTGVISESPDYDYDEPDYSDAELDYFADLAEEKYFG